MNRFYVYYITAEERISESQIQLKICKTKTNIPIG